ncbi:class I adenylate-forming enzyme family protein [Streptomyces sp. NBC_01716]|uniref:class I adenylate-forming enzyme family protein n=1 Tax=Streptomyces sp. NBC_01716 TaxID=2975917 RepID=UPI002E3098D5|nr:class I adenylate-forming enzyme family protein [Streptomyces sp. NBC_01716]
MPDTAALTAPGAPFEVVRAENGSLMYADGPRTLREFVETTWAYGERPFFVGGDGTGLLTYGEFFAAATMLANRFVDTYGLRPGDRAALVMGDRPDWQTAFWATQLAGLVAVPLDAGWSADELDRVLDHCAPRVLLVDGERLPAVTGWAERARARVMVFGPGEADGALTERYEDLPAPDPYAAPPDTEIRAEDDATIEYPSPADPLRGAVSTQLAQAGAAMDARYRAAAEALGRGELPGLGQAPVTRLTAPFSGPAAFFEVYGAMAAGGALMLDVPAGPPGKPPLVATPAVESRVAPDTGEVWLRGQSLPYAYWRDERATAEAFTADGWVRTG